MSEPRAQWGSKLGFILAAAGSAVGLGNLWKFPYITGENGGGAFVAIYLLSIAFVGLPIMIGEVLVGRMAQSSNVGAFRTLSKPKSPWISIGWLGVVTAFVLLSYYSVVAGWALTYFGMALKGSFSIPQTAITTKAIFSNLIADGPKNLIGHFIFMALTIVIVIGGVQKGVERASKILMPALFLMLTVLLIFSMRQKGFAEAKDFVFGFHTEKLTSSSVLEAVGHSFFTLSVGMGAMLTFGSYMTKDQDIVSASIATTLFDTLVALMACLVLFPITFTYGMKPAQGPGLVFINMPTALSQMPGGQFWSLMFFGLLIFAALTSAISLLEAAAVYFIDERGWSRRKAVLSTGLAIAILGIPSALSNGTGFFAVSVKAWIGKNWFDAFDYLCSSWFLPLGGLGIAIFVSWRVGGKARELALASGSSLGGSKAFYLIWLQLLRYVVPVAILAIMAHVLFA
jgi:neurotransmitter:Na+ symporter, NSS family